MKRSSNSSQNFQDKIQCTQDSNGEIIIKIKNPYPAGKIDADLINCKEKDKFLEKIRLTEIFCENCDQAITLNTKLQLERSLQNPEDVDFKETVLARLDKIEEMLMSLVGNYGNQENFSSTSKFSQSQQMKTEVSEIEDESYQVDEFYLEEEHLEESVLEAGSDKSSVKSILNEVDKYFPINSIQDMVVFNELLLDNEEMLENILSYMKFLNFKISTNISDTTKCLQRLVADDVLKQYSWDESQTKLVLKEMIFFSKIIYGKVQSFTKKNN